MKKIITTLCLAMGLQAMQAQVLQNTNWTLPPYYLEVPKNPSDNGTLKKLMYIPVGYADPFHNVVSNSISDKNGNILFYVKGHDVINADGHTVDKIGARWYGNSDKLRSCGNLANAGEVAVFPDPANCRRYYIIGFSHTVCTGNEDGGDGIFHPFYAIYDLDAPSIMALPYYGRLITGGYGNNLSNDLLDLLPPGVSTYANKALAGRTGGAIAVSKLRSDNSRLIYIATAFDNLYRFKVTPNGITYDYMHYDYSDGIEDVWDKHYSEMELFEKTDGSKYLAFTTSVFNKFHFMNLDNNGDIVSDITVQGLSSNGVFKGFEFSPDGRYLYLTSNESPYLSYYDISNNQILSLSTNIAFKNTFLELGPDSRIYGRNSNSFVRIDNPNHPTTSNINYNYFPINATGDNLLNYDLSYSLHQLYDATFYSMPDQVDGMNYLDHFYKDEQCCIKNEIYEVATYKTIGSAIWTPFQNSLNNNSGSVVLIKDSLFVRAGHTITIENMELRFAPGAKLILEQGTSTQKGAHLILKNTLLTADTRCTPEAMWQGVIVTGNASLPQGNSIITTHQAMIEITQNSVIENAMVGVYLGVPVVYNWQNPNTNSVPNGGGIIKAVNATFRNNVEDVRFNDYENYNNGQKHRNLSYFVNVNFLTTSALNIPTLYPVSHVVLRTVRGIDFKGCHFENSYGFHNGIPVPQWGRGIVSYNSEFKVLPYCQGVGSIFCTPNNGNKSSFINLYYGVAASSPDPSKQFTCDYVDFENNLVGVNAAGILNLNLLNNTFKLLNTSISQSVGGYLYNCSRYHIEGNSFEENDNFTSPVLNGYGLVVYNSNGSALTRTDNNSIYRNAFKNLNIAIQSQSQNGSPTNVFTGSLSPMHGLVVQCNTFEDEIHIDVALPSGNIKYFQGYCEQNPSVSNVVKTQLLAGNTFNHNNYTTQDYFKKGAYFYSNFLYAYHADPSSPNPYKTYDNTWNNYNVTECSPTVFTSTSCPIKSVRGLIQVNNSMTAHQVTASDLRNLNLQLFEKEQDVEAASRVELFDILSSNLSLSGKLEYLLGQGALSDSVLKAYIDLLPPVNDLKAILEAQEGISVELANYIISVYDTEFYFISSLVNNNGKYLRLLFEYSNLKTQKDNLLKNINYLYNDFEFRAYLEESGSSFVDSLIVIAEESNYVDDKLLGVNILSDRESNKFNDLISDIKGIDDKLFNVTFLLYTSHRLALRNKTVENYVLDSLYIYDNLLFIYNDSLNDGLSSSNAKAFLDMASYIEELTYWVEPLVLQGGKPSFNKDSIQENKLSKILIYPNPTQDDINILSMGKGDESFDRIEVVNTLGQVILVEKTSETQEYSINMSDFNTGAYIIRVFNAGLPIHQQIIIKK